ncbi:MAG: hypothetical protein GXY83_08400 [Rhodopirellula sp.]|nr:hypothetical protein [Rhodopirellula sp.]
MNDESRPSPPESHGNGPRLSGAEAADLADQVARLAKAGLPLSPGFRAMAEELPRSRIARVLGRIADRLDAGASLDAALEAERKSFPAHLRELVTAGSRSGKLAAVLERLVALERARMELRRRIAINLAYPILLLGALLAMFTLFAVWIVPQFRQIFIGFGTELPAITQFVLAVSRYGIWIVWGVLLGGLALALLLRLAAPALAVRLWHLVPLIGPMARWSRMSQFASLMEILLDLEVPAPEALRVCAGGLREPDLAGGCRKVAVEVESGHPLAESLSRHRQFPPTLAPFVAWGQAHANMPEAFRAAGEAFEGCAEGDMVLLETVLLPFTLVVILSGAFFLIIGLFLPLINLFQNLT